jgi:NTE family protein
MTNFKKALVLSGGSVKGAFQAGALSVALKHYQPEAIYGVSVGALNGAFIANRANEIASHGRKINWETIGSELCEFWIDEIQYPEDIILRRSIMGAAINVAFHKWNGLYSNSPLKAKIDGFMKETVFEIPGTIYLSVGVVDLHSGEKIYVDFQASGMHFKDYILASASIPFIMPTSQIERNYGLRAFLDGGLRNSSPLSQALKKGATEVLCIYCHPEDIGENYSFNSRVFKQYSERILDIVTNESIHNDHKLGVLYNKLLATGIDVADPQSPLYGKIIVEGIEKPLRPQEQLEIDIEDFNKDDICRLIDLGRSAAEKYFADIPARSGNGV